MPSRHFQVLVEEPVNEKFFWRTVTGAEEIMRNGVMVKPPNSPEPHMYVCAVQTWGPGKLVRH